MVEHSLPNGSTPQEAPARKNAALPLLVGVNCLAVSVLVGMVAFNSKPTPAPPEAPLVYQMDKLQLSMATEALSEERKTKESQLVTALLPHAERGVADFVSLQVIAAELRVKEMDWVYLPKQGDLVPVELELRASGSYYNLPILLDGLYRQSRPVEITYLAVETPTAMVAQTDVLLRLRFHRPLSATTAWLAEQAESLSLAGDPDGTLDALIEAEKLEKMAAFEAELPRLRALSRRNRTAIMTTVPGLLRRLPTSALGWVGLELRGGEVVVLNEP
jgi:hypothetical protein